MSPLNKAFLDENFHVFMVYERAFFIRNLGAANRENMVRVMREEFHPNYSCDLWCPTCCGDMIVLLYRNYYNYLKALHGDNTVYKDLTEGIEALKDKPIIVAASFPSNLPGVNSKDVIPSEPTLIKENHFKPLNKKRKHANTIRHK